MKRIIVPTNFTDVSWQATLHALEYCKVFDVEMLIIHVYTNSNNALNANPISINDSIDSEDEKMKELIIKIKKLQTYDSLTINTLCVGGKLSTCINNTLSNPGEDFIVMGTEGATNSIKKIIGTHANRVVNDVNAPILLIPTGFTFSLATPITCAIDFGSNILKEDINLLEKLVNTGNVSLFKVIHIVEGYEPSDKIIPLHQFENIKIDYDEIIGDNIPKLLEKYSRIVNSRLLVLVKKDRGFLENLFQTSILNTLTINANVPMLILRSTHD